MIVLMDCPECGRCVRQEVLWRKTTYLRGGGEKLSVRHRCEGCGKSHLTVYGAAR